MNGGVSPRDDIEIINLELVMSDLQTLGKRLTNLEREVKNNNKNAIKEYAVCKKIMPALEAGKLASTIVLTPEEIVIAKQLNLLTRKPILYVLNKKTGALNLDEENGVRWQELMGLMGSINASFVIVDAGVEAELSSVSSDDRGQFRQEFGVLDDGVNTLIKKGFELLELITFFTTGEDETRGWQIHAGSPAPKAGAAIHSDFEDKFIRAEVISYGDLLASGSRALAREKGLLRTEGKEYIVKDGDVVEFKI